MSEAWICKTCGIQYPPSEQPPAECGVCSDERQYVNPDGQQWTTLSEIQSDRRNVFTELEPGLHAIHSEPGFAIGQRALLIETSAGNLLWDCIALIDDDTIECVRELGGIDAIAVSHCHYYTTMLEWSRAFDAPIHIHENDRPWVVRPDEAVRFWSGEKLPLFDGLTLLKVGGHFEGSQVAHWEAGAEGRGVVLSGDMPFVTRDRKWVTFMYSYPNMIPVGPETVRSIDHTLRSLPFDRLYGAFPGQDLLHDADSIVRRSAERYIRAIGYDPAEFVARAR